MRGMARKETGGLLPAAALAVLLTLAAACGGGGGGGSAPAATQGGAQPGATAAAQAGSSSQTFTGPQQPAAGPAVHILEPFAGSTVTSPFTVRLAVDQFRPGAGQDGFVVVQLDGKTVATTDQLQVTVTASPGSHALTAMLVDPQKKPLSGSAALVNEAVTVK